MYRSIRRKRKKGPAASVKIPQGCHLFISYNFNCFNSNLILVFPTSKCKLRLLKLERIKDYLLMEQEFIQNQEIHRPREEKNDVSIFVFIDVLNLTFYSLE